MNLPQIPNPIEQTRAVLEAQTRVVFMLAEAQAVIAYRCLGLVGLWPQSPGERQRMVKEKAPAFAASMAAATRSLMAGQSPDKIIDAAVRPIRRKTRANASRLSRGK